MTWTLRKIQDEQTTHLMWFVEHGFHQMIKRRAAAKKELESRGIDTSKLMHVCLCNECSINKTKT